MSIAGKGRVTISKVAECAGVSRAAVYAVLNEHKSVNIRVSEPIRRRVREVIEELGYIPNESARTLVSGKSRNVGLILPDSGSRLSRALTAEMGRIFLGHGFLVIPYYSDNSLERERALLNCFLGKNVDGLIYAGLDRDVNRDIFDRFHDYGIPTILVGFDVKFDEIRVMELAAAHAAEAGAARVGFLGYRDRLVFSVAERLKFLKLALLGNPKLAFIGSVEVAGYAECLDYAESLAAGKAEKPDVVVCYNDRLASLLVQCLLVAGIRVPEQVGVIGIDGFRDTFDPMPLTSVRLPVEDMVEAVWNVFESGELPAEAIRIAPELVAGATT